MADKIVNSGFQLGIRQRLKKDDKIGIVNNGKKNSFKLKSPKIKTKIAANQPKKLWIPKRWVTCNMPRPIRK